MRKIGYFKFDEDENVKDGVYEYIDSYDFIGVINPVMKYGYHGWEADKYEIELGYREGELGDWVVSKDCKILPLTPAIKLLYGISPKG